MGELEKMLGTNVVHDKVHEQIQFLDIGISNIFLSIDIGILLELFTSSAQLFTMFHKVMYNKHK